MTNVFMVASIEVLWISLWYTYEIIYIYISYFTYMPKYILQHVSLASVALNEKFAITDTFMTSK